MSVAATPTTRPGLALPVIRRWRLGATFAVLSLLSLLLIGIDPAPATVTFRLAEKHDAVRLADIDLPAVATGWVLSALMLLLALWALMRGARGANPPVWASTLFWAAFVVAMLVWAVSHADAHSLSLPGLLAGSLALSVPLIFGSMSGLLCERSGVVNIAIEGQLLFGAFAAAVVASLAANAWFGLIAAPIAGALVGALLVLFAVVFRVDQIIVGVVLNTLVLGLTGFFFSTLLSQDRATWNARQSLPELPIPLLSEIPVLGPVLFKQTILVYLMYVLLVVLHVMLFRSTWGLRTRAIGEHPKAADTVGVDVNRLRVVNTLIGGAVAGLGGAFFTIGAGLAFGRDMSAGNGFIALAAMILGRWSPKGAVVAALLFGFTKNLGNVLSSIGSPLPTDLLLMLPYLVTIVAVAGLVGKVRAPAAEGKAYVKGRS